MQMEWLMAIADVMVQTSVNFYDACLPKHQIPRIKQRISCSVRRYWVYFRHGTHTGTIRIGCE